MPLIDTVLGWDILPDFVIRKGIRKLLRQRLKDERGDTPEKRLIQVSQFAEDLKKYPVAIETRAANEQHYEVPAAFYRLCLGPRLKYSSCFYQEGNESIKEAEEAMLSLTCQRAELKDGQKILELGCGWGSLTLWMAEKYPLAQITSVSNSSSQREYILDQCKKRGLNNVSVITCDMNQFSTSPETFDRVVSVEMFEHMKNWQELLRRISSWLKSDGKLFFHIFTHRDCAYHFESKDGTDWMSRHFFTGGIMPSNNLITYFQDNLKVEKQWEVSGKHYGQTAEHWLENTDQHRDKILEIFVQTYGRSKARQWLAYWRIFFMACAELWNFEKGEEWMVCHTLMSKK